MPTRQNAAELVYASKWGLKSAQSFRSVDCAIEFARGFAKEAINFYPDRSDEFDSAFCWAVLNDPAAGLWRDESRFSKSALIELRRLAEAGDRA